MTDRSTATTLADRRPLASRGWPVMHTLARAVAQTGITPNMVSTAGMVGGIVAGAALAATSRVEPGAAAERLLLVGAALAIQFRLVCNLIDGMVAVEGGKRSALGEIFNEVPDRISDAATLIGAGYAVGSSPVLGFTAACLAIFVAYLRAVGKGCGMVSDFSGPMAKQQRMFVVTLAAVLLAALPVSVRPSLGPVTDSPSAGIMFIVLAIIIAGCVITSVRRLGHIRTFLQARGAT